MTTVLIVEDEVNLRTSMARGLSRLPGVTVLEAGRVDEAIRVSEQHVLDVVFSDLDLPDRSGLELIGPLRAHGRNPRLVFISAYLTTYRSRVPLHVNVELKEKPVTLEELRAIVESVASLAAPGEGTPFSVADYVQIAMMGRRSVVIEVDGGEIVIVDGNAWAARDGRGEGDAAFMRLALAKDARCRTLRGQQLLRNVHGHAEFLLMEAARLADEAVAAAPDAVTALDDVGGAVGTVGSSGAVADASDDFDVLVDDSLDAVLRKDFARAAALLLRAHALRPADTRVNTNLKRLRALGVVDVDVDATPNVSAARSPS